MSDVIAAGGEPANETTVPAEGPISVAQAFESYTRRNAEAQRTRAADGKFASDQSEPTESAPQEPDAAPPSEAPGETETAEPAEDLPPITPPRSWTADQRERFAQLPRELQEYVSERESTRETEFRRSQNEVAQQRQAIQAQLQAAEQQRAYYEQAIQSALGTVQAQMQGEFGDIRTPADLQRLAEQEPDRFNRFQAQREIQQHLYREAMQQQQQRQYQEAQQFRQWSAEQDRLFSEYAKDFADPAKVEKATNDVVNYLSEVGLKKEQLPALWNQPMFRDAMMQRIVFDASKWHAAQQAAKKAAAKPVPPVQRPGPAAVRPGLSQEIAQLEKQLGNATNVRDQIRAAADLRAAKRAASVKKG